MYYLGVDLGGTGIKVGVVDEQGKILGTAKCPTGVERGYGPVIADMAKLCFEAVEKCNVSMDDVKAIGIGIPGIQDPATGLVPFCTNLGWHQVPLVSEMQKYIDKPVFIGNDATVAGLAEAVAGVSAGASTSVFVTLGTGVGGGIILDGKLLTGVNGAAGEIGHMSVEMDGIPCPCGRSGCFEQYASATALVRQTREAMEQDREKTSRLWELSDGDPANVNGLVLFTAAREGDGRALMVLDKFTTYLAIGVADLINIFQPDVLCIGGGISKQGDFLIQPLIRKVEELRYTKHSKKQTTICAATLGNDAGIIGAALLSNVK